MNPLTPIRSYLSEAWKMTCLSRYSLSHKINQEPFMILWIFLDHLHPTKPVGTTLRSVQKTKQLSSSHGLNKQTLGSVGSFQGHVDLYSNYINFTRLIGEGECTNTIWIQIMNSVYQSMVSYHKQTAHPENPSQNPSLVSQELGNIAPSTFWLGWKALIITLSPLQQFQNQRVFNPSSGRDTFLSWPAPRIAGMEMTNIWDGPDCDKKTRFVPGK